MQLFVKDLTVMDFSYLCPERGMVGESWIVDVVLHGELDEQSMVLDFGLVKKRLKRLIDEHVDHKLLVPADHAYAHIQHGMQDDNVAVDFLRPNASIHLNCPAEAYAFVYADSVTPESVRQYLRDVIATELPDNVDDIELTLRTEVIDGPYYHYTHGLKKHEGNCQRIAHGHRSKIEIFVQQQPAKDWDQRWAERWADIYIGSSEDLVTDTQMELTAVGQAQSFLDHHLFAYESSQGRFELAIPKAESEVVETDSTVECLAQFIATQVKQGEAASDVKVVAYEGVGKGAIGYA